MENTKQKILEIRTKIAATKPIFAKKQFLETSLALNILSREKELERAIQYLTPYNGCGLPFIQVVGKSGTGKSTIIELVCQSLTDVVCYSFVNLRKAGTHFGCANLILSNLGCQPVKSSEGIHVAIGNIEKRICKILKKKKRANFILVLDEFDAIFSDRRAKSSEFVYKLLDMVSNVRKRGFELCIVSISNTRFDKYFLEERVRSRMGEYQIYFPPYKKDELLQILRARADEAFANKVSEEVLEECAYLCSNEDGDCRRALQLLQLAGESSDGQSLTVSDVKLASKKLDEDYLEEVIKTATPHQRLLLFAMARLYLIDEKEEHSTQEIFSTYEGLNSSIKKKLEYRRVFDLLDELENMGIVISKTRSSGRGGYQKFHRLTMHFSLVGCLINKEIWCEHRDQVAETKRFFARGNNLEEK